MDIVTGHVGSAHVTSWQDRDLNQGIFGPDTYILNVGSKMAATIISNNEIHIADGTLVMQGCQGVIQKGTYDSISIDNGSSGMKRIDLICAEYTKVGGVESLGWTVIKGTPAASNPSDPSYTSGDIQNGDTPVQVPVYRAVLDGLTLTSVDALVDTAGTIASSGTMSFVGGNTQSVASGMSYKTLQTIPVTSTGVYIVEGYVQSNDIDELALNGMIVADDGGYLEANGIMINRAFTNAGKYGVHICGLVEVLQSTILYLQCSHTTGSTESVYSMMALYRVG